jgi:hypothetical protein
VLSLIVRDIAEAVNAHLLDLTEIEDIAGAFCA